MLSSAALLALIMTGMAGEASAHCVVDDNLARSIGPAGHFSPGAIADAGAIERAFDRWHCGYIEFGEIVSHHIAVHGATIAGRESEVFDLLFAIGANAPEVPFRIKQDVLDLYQSRVADERTHHPLGSHRH